MNEIDLNEPVPPLPLMRDRRSPLRYVYVASSWRNLYQPAVVAALRSVGLDVYDFKNPPPPGCPDGFRWSEIDGGWQTWTPAQWREALRHPVAQQGYASDRGGMDRADCCVLVLPSGRSAHMEAAFMAASGKPVFTLALERVEPDLMNLLLGPADHICVTLDELYDRLGVMFRVAAADLAPDRITRLQERRGILAQKLVEKRLTPAEDCELAAIDQVLDRYSATVSPLPFDLLERLEAEARRLKPATGPP